MAIKWHDENGEFYYDHSDDDVEDNERDFKLHLLNLMAGISDNLNDLASKLYEMDVNARGRN